jgi:hypothetical protein
MTEEQQKLRFTEKTAKSKADAMIKRLVGGREVYDLMKADFEQNFLISGKPMSEWVEEFRVTIPTDNLTPQMIQEIGLQVMELHQKAAFHHAAAQALTQFIKRGGELSYYHKFNSLVEDHKTKNEKLPAAATLEAMAKADTGDEESAVFRSDVGTRFWKLILEHLATCRKILETASYSVNNELRLEQQQNYIERMGSRNGNH